MSVCNEVVRHGIVISVHCLNESYRVYFNNAPGEFHDLHQVTGIHGLKSIEEAVSRGIEFVDAHQISFVENVGTYELYVRLGWEEKWYFIIKSGDCPQVSVARYNSREDAIVAGRINVGHDKIERESRISAK